jgi:lipopolysaccharide transport system ATP-binding protein
MSDIVLRTVGLGKMYHIGGERQAYRTLRDTIAQTAKRPIERIRHPGAATHTSGEFWALRNIDLEVSQGDVLGIIGRNGAGKSTLLKVLSHITEPTEGRVEIRGRTSSLLDVGTGFHPELTGRENIYLNGSILGMNKAEIDRRFDEIVEFSEIELFLDTPVKRYSSGMYVRLAFAVAAHLEPDTLIVDEVLAVGDVAFQKKCLGKMGAEAASGKTVLLVSHNMAAVENLCSRALLLEHGKCIAIGRTQDVLDAYLSLITATGGEDLALREDRQGNGKLRFTTLEFRAGGGARRTDVVRCSDDLEFVVGYKATQNLSNVSMSIVVYTLSGQVLICLGNEMTGSAWATAPREGRMSCLVRRLALAPGQYTINLCCYSNGVIADWVQSAGSLTVEAGDFFGTGKLPPDTHGGMLVDQEWGLDGA